MARRDSFSILRETMRWRVSLVLAALIVVLTFSLALLNSRLGLNDTALLAFAISGVASALLVALLTLPRGKGATLFFASIFVLEVATIAFGYFNGRPMQHWAYIAPPVLIFLLRAGPAVALMIFYGVFVTAVTSQVAATIDVVRFASGYGLLCCFMYTYALLQERAEAMLLYHSERDALTNCLNRRTFNEALAQIRDRCAFLLIDIDHFKAINDQHGHLVGDRVITQAAAALVRELEPGTPLYRYGGEEFAVILDRADATTGAMWAERLRVAMEATDLQGVHATISVGVAEWRPGSGSTEAALARADAALYAAKRGGRNRVEVATAAALQAA